MFPEPQGVHGGEPELLVGPHVPGQEAADVRVPGVAAAIYRVAIIEGKQRLAVIIGQALPQPPKVVGQVPETRLMTKLSQER